MIRMDFAILLLIGDANGQDALIWVAVLENNLDRLGVEF